MKDEELLRYSRQIMLPELDIEGQNSLRDATVALIGLGGLGSPAALYLGAAGVGHLKLCDHDTVELSNLQRQIAHGNDDIGVNKAASVAASVAQVNPHVRCSVYSSTFGQALDGDFLTDVDLVLDCTDGFAVRSLINETCWQAGVPVVSGAAIRWQGQITVFDPKQETSPCYRCLYTDIGEQELNCAENGVIAPLVGVIGALQALEAIKYIAQIGTPLIGKVAYFDAKYAEWRTFKLQRRPDCPVCGDG